MFFFREAVRVYETQGEWARVSQSYTASCNAGRSAFGESGNNACSPENGINGGYFAEWVHTDFLSRTRPVDPAAGATGIAALIGQSDDFGLYEQQFVAAAVELIESGRCTEADFREMDGWLKSVTTYADRPVYFTYCGGMTLQNRLYLDVSTGQIFR